MVAVPGDALERVAATVRDIARSYEPPDFAHVPDPDAAVFLCAVDHKTGYEQAHEVGGRGPFHGSELMWELGLAAAERDAGLLRAERLMDVSAERIAAWFRAGDETVADPDRRAELWRDLARGLVRDHAGSAQVLLDASDGSLGGDEGLVRVLGRYAAYSDPLAKKAFLFAKIAERRGWLRVRDPEAWQVAADNVLMRLALRSGLVSAGPLERVRADTRDALRALATASGVSVPVLDDLLWELGRDNPDLLGSDAGDLREPGRDPASAWY